MCYIILFLLLCKFVFKFLNNVYIFVISRKYMIGWVSFSKKNNLFFVYDKASLIYINIFLNLT